MRTVLIGFFCTAGSVFSQTDSIAPYIQKIDGKISTQIFALDNSNSFKIDYQSENTKVNVVPNKRTTLNVGVNYDFISFSFGFAPDVFADNRNNRDSKMFSTSLNLFPGRIVQHFDLYYQKGMSLDVAGSDAGIYLKNLKSLKIGGSTSYLFNPNYSFRAIAMQDEKQLRSAGSFAPGISYYYTQIDGTKVENMGGQIHFIDVAVNPAYYYTWVLGGNFRFAAGLSAGAGITWTIDEPETMSAALYQGSVMLAPGYNSKTWFFGIYGKYTYADHKSDVAVNISDSVTMLTAFVGYRFDAPDFLSSEMSNVKQKLKKQHK